MGVEQLVVSLYREIRQSRWAQLSLDLRWRLQAISFHFEEQEINRIPSSICSWLIRRSNGICSGD